MTRNEFMTADAHTGQGLSEHAAQAVAHYFGPRAAAVDRGELDVREGLRFLADIGLLAGPDFRTRWQVIAAVTKSCMASGFSLWAHTMVYECLAASDRAEIRSTADQLRDGTLFGSTAMASAIQNMAGLGAIATSFRREGDVVIVNGHIRWASNLFQDGFVVVFPSTSDTDGQVIVALSSDNPGVKAGPPLQLLALGATCSSDLTLREARATEDSIISTDFVPYMRKMKPRLLLLQSALGIGLAQGALEGAAARASTTGEHFRHAYRELVEQLEELETHNAKFIASGGSANELTRHRLRTAQLAREAVGLELRVSGGAGYLADSAVARRVREVAFLPVQAPTEEQLWLELEA